MNFQKAHRISAIRTLLGNDERLLELFFSHKEHKINGSPQDILISIKTIPPPEQLLIKTALDIWCLQGGAKFSDLLTFWGHEEWSAYIQSRPLYTPDTFTWLNMYNKLYLGDKNGKSYLFTRA